MRKRIFWRNGLAILGLLTALAGLHARADVLVSVTMFSLSPNPVNISTGEAVFWTDADGGGPYGIYFNGASTQTDSGGLQFNQAGSYGYYDDNGNIGTVNVQANTPPVVTIINPTNQASFTAPASFSFTATATDAEGLSDVEFYVGTNFVDDIFSEPFTTSVTNLPAGIYTLTVIAYDNVYVTATNSITITVAAAPPPKLIANRLGNKLVISWSTNNAAGLSLQFTTNLLSGIGWAAVPITPAPIASQMVVTNPIVGAKQFFRLSNH